MERRPRSFDSEHVLQKATELFWRHGYDATSVKALTEALGIRTSSLYASFGDKRQLFETILERYQTYGQHVADQAFDRAANAYEAIESYLRALTVEYADPSHPPGCLVITAAVNCAPASADVEQRLRGIRQAARQGLIARIQADIDAGLLAADVDAEALGTYVAAVIQGMSTQARDGATTEDLLGIVELAMRAMPTSR
ncbi:TetR/AcrR family transcriptional regulator [Natronoglycomyces albus]|uniref:TetR/AcrR family transcriptional regulator n=1 Tax=Natronoglycomyces albus TaxID=2811108 RepID=A0A895XPK1_9ACTN|nr:TetR/AcrR family transcriptional regulator [Natronoglycomyces albus]QSB07087.1 TetR/AcrR family transcriptional regulator [Natronoglycomyces albus]